MTPIHIALAALSAITLAAGPLAAESASIRYAISGGQERVKHSDPSITPATPFAIASVGKAFTAAALLRLAERGLVSLDDPVAAVLPPKVAAGYPALDGLTLRHLLSMTSGLPDYYDESFFEAALADPDRMQRQEAAVATVAGEPAMFPPGSAYDYSNTNYLLLGLVLEHLTGQDYATVITQEVLTPAGLTDSFVFGSRPLPPDFAAGHPDRDDILSFYSGEAFGDGGIIASARDVARFYSALFADDLLLSDAMQAEMLADPDGWAYGLGVEIEGTIVGHSGADFGYLADVRMDLATGEVAVVLVADEDGDNSWAADYFAD
jgi:D-alanyl-D-alanine carboxypeptidase